MHLPFHHSQNQEALKQMATSTQSGIITGAIANQTLKDKIEQRKKVNSDQAESLDKIEKMLESDPKFEEFYKLIVQNGLQW